MKTLYLIRHAKSSWKDVDLSDFERPLNERGKRDVVTMGERLLDKNIMPDCVLASSAKRTRSTAKKITKIVGFDSSNIEFIEDLYHSGTHTLLNYVNNISDKNESAFVVVHNPGVSNFCDYLTNSAIDFPTCGIAKITFGIDSWKEVSSNLGNLEWFDYPKNND